MIIGYDGKRAFQNKTGLGNYSRSLVTILSFFFPKNRYVLFAPKQTALFDTIPVHNIDVQTPHTTFFKRLPSLWRRIGMVKEITKAGLDIYHGLSNELPLGIEKKGIKKVVTIHDIIFERFPSTYNIDERYIHRWKIKRACKVTDVVIAISRQTKEDLVNIYGVNPAKIFTCYQSCNPIFEQKISPAELALIKHKYRLPQKYFLFVSSITPRKNLLAICKAMVLLKEKLTIPLVVIGDGKKEKEAVRKFMNEHSMADRLMLLNELPQAQDASFTSAADFPAIYQQALALIYPSIFEGFGLPILEALWSRLPVICSNTSSMPEVAGDAALYFAPDNHALLADHMYLVATDDKACNDLKEKGFRQAQNFTASKYAESLMKIYTDLL